MNEYSSRAKDLIRRMQSEICQDSIPPLLMRSGRVRRVSDGVVFIGGLSDCFMNEKLVFANGQVGMVMSLEADVVGAITFADTSNVEEGNLVYRTGELLTVPTGYGLLGRVVDPLGNPLDEKAEFSAEAYRSIGAEAPELLSRQPVTRPMQSGIMAVDALVPIGRGQRELIIGDRQTGKTTLAVDCILNQAKENMICVYVAIGQKKSLVRQISERLREAGALRYTFIVSASASSPSAMQYIAPYAGCAMAEFFMHRGRDVLIVFDDLSKQAVAYREISLLLRRPAGREAYPGDVFYLHSRLLERAAQLSDDKGGGSMTALPIIETQAGDVSAYIPTNVISITDGQIFLESTLFHAGQRPAINVGISVSRVGGSAQLQAMKKVAGRLRIDLAQYRELLSFSQFGADLDAATLQSLARGGAMMGLLRQSPASPLSVGQQVVLIKAGLMGIFDNLEDEELKEKRTRLLDFFSRGRSEEFLTTLSRSGKYDAAIEKKLEKLIEQFRLSTITELHRPSYGSLSESVPLSSTSSVSVSGVQSNAKP